MENDMDILEFARAICMLSIDTPISREFDEKYGQKGGWWSCQREHLTVWCINQQTLGISNFKRNAPNHSAKVMYNNFGRPETLLWLAEALGERKEILTLLVNNIKHKNARSACAEIRKSIPFDRILELIKHQK